MSDIKPRDIEALSGNVRGFRLERNEAQDRRPRDVSVEDARREARGRLGRVRAPRRAVPRAGRGAPLPRPPPRQARRAAGSTPDHWLTVRAPNLGTFYRAPKPGAPPYVKIGQHVDADTELCLIEVMKLFTTVLAGVSGVVRQVLVEDAELVEFDQALFLIEPAA